MELILEHMIGGVEIHVSAYLEPTGVSHAGRNEMEWDWQVDRAVITCPHEFDEWREERGRSGEKLDDIVQGMSSDLCDAIVDEIRERRRRRRSF